MRKEDFNIGTRVWVIKQYGTIKTGCDVQILDYTVGFLGEDSFICKDYRNTRSPEIFFYECFPTVEDAIEAAKVIYSKHFKSITFKKLTGDAYTVYLEE